MVPQPAALAANRPESPLVGRAAELSQPQDCWRAMPPGEGSLAVLFGLDPGVTARVFRRSWSAPAGAAQDRAGAFIRGTAQHGERGDESVATAVRGLDKPGLARIVAEHPAQLMNANRERCDANHHPGPEFGKQFVFGYQLAQMVKRIRKKNESFVAQRQMGLRLQQAA